MNNVVYYVLVIVVGYFCGCIESGYLVGKLCGMDIRDYGSGNSGTTNVLRVQLYCSAKRLYDLR